MNESNRIESNRIDANRRESTRIDACTTPTRLERRTTKYPSRAPRDRRLMHLPRSPHSRPRERTSPRPARVGLPSSHIIRRITTRRIHEDTHDRHSTRPSTRRTHHTHTQRLHTTSNTCSIRRTHIHTYARHNAHTHTPSDTRSSQDRSMDRKDPPPRSTHPSTDRPPLGRQTSASMSVVGFDFGSANNVVALARRKGIDVVLNDESKRETPCMVNFGEKQVRDDHDDEIR